MRFCTNCGSEVPRSGSVCTSCRAPVRWAEELDPDGQPGLDKPSLPRDVQASDELPPPPQDEQTVSATPIWTEPVSASAMTRQTGRSGRDGRRWRTPVIGLLVAALLAGLGVGAGYLWASKDKPAIDKPAEQVAVVLEASNSSREAFTPSVESADGAFSDQALQKVDELSSDFGPTVSADKPGVFGGSSTDSVCDPDALVKHLESNPAMAQAWATTQGIDVSNISTWVGDLTPVFLAHDTRVTNHGFKSGKVTQWQAVLQAGTGVLVDSNGVPRVRCKCGNPLKVPEELDLSAAKVPANAWEGYTSADVITIDAAEVQLTELPMVDIKTGELTTAPVGLNASDIYLPECGSTRGLVAAKPTSFSPHCLAASGTVSGISWSQWSAKGAKGAGTWTFTTCNTSAACEESVEVEIVATNPVQCTAGDTSLHYFSHYELVGQENQAYDVLSGTECALSSEPTQTTPSPSSRTSTSTASADSAPPATRSQATNSGAGEEAINGRWCNVNDTDDGGMLCYEVALPNVTYDEGTVVDIAAHGSPWDRGNGVFDYASPDAPFGTFYPAGVPIDDYNGSAGPDPVDQDRIWNSQIELLATRQGG